MHLKYTLISSAKIIPSHFLLNDDDYNADQVQKFINLLNNSEDANFGDAIFLLNQNKQINLRKPKNLPLEDDIETLRNNILKKIRELENLKSWTLHQYVDARDFIVSRLTLFNARRGSEPSRLLLREWEEAQNADWINHVSTRISFDP